MANSANENADEMSYGGVFINTPPFIIIKNYSFNAIFNKYK
ncbi:hypothetical protein [Snodgrassella alvi]|nr:hypothetical protein [Snodgrassella alvi]